MLPFSGNISSPLIGFGFFKLCLTWPHLVTYNDMVQIQFDYRPRLSIVAKYCPIVFPCFSSCCKLALCCPIVAKYGLI